jgi:3-hydroxyacyl-CoA dehydrogenase
MNYKQITVAGSGVLGSRLPIKPRTRDFHITVAEANSTSNPEFEKLASLLKKEYIAKGKLGRATGQAFYTYPNPSFARPDFLRNQ